MNEFKLSQGIDIENLEGIYECYEISENNLIANISFENLKPILINLCKALRAPAFFFIEIPCDEETENQFREKQNSNFHSDVYYLDNCTIDVVLAIIERYGDLLFNDGIVKFGFGSHDDEDEICIGKYKIFYIYSKNITKYSSALDSFKLIQEKQIKTVWDNFSDLTPGSATSVDVNGETIYDIVNNLKEVGLYFSHTIED